MFIQSFTMDVAGAARFYSDYYTNQVQTGGGAPRYYKGSVFQRGHGFGSFMSSMLNLAKPIGKTLARSGIKALAGVADDILTGVPPREAAKRRAAQEFEQIKSGVSKKLINTLGIPPPKKRKKTTKKQKRRKKHTDVFGTY